MEIRESDFFSEFADTIMSGSEHKAYLVQLRGLPETAGKTGCVQRLIKTGGRVLLIEYYLSRELDSLFVLTAHIVRAGEPREKEKKALRAYLSRIREMEK